MNKNRQRIMITTLVLGVATLGASLAHAQSGAISVTTGVSRSTVVTTAVPVQAAATNIIKIMLTITSAAPVVSVAPVSATTTNNNIVANVAPSATWREGDWIMWVLALLGATGGATVFFQMLALRERRVVPRALLEEMLARIRAGELNEARRACEERPCPLSSVALTTFDHLRRTSRGGALLREVVTAECHRQTVLMQVAVRWLRDAAILAILCGFLGATMGVWQTLDAAPHDANMAPAIVDGVAAALTFLVFGLLVAIPALLFYSWLKRRALRLTAALEVAAAEILLVLADRYER